jgi:hypothetical protein
VRTYLFAFEDRESARRFVRRLVRTLRDVVVYIDDCHVRVIDGSPTERGDRIALLATRTSSSSSMRAVPPDADETADPDGTKDR